MKLGLIIIDRIISSYESKTGIPLMNPGFLFDLSFEIDFQLKVCVTLGIKPSKKSVFTKVLLFQKNFLLMPSYRKTLNAQTLRYKP